MKDEKLKLRDLHVSHTLCCAGNWGTPKDKTRLIDEKFASDERVCVCETMDTPSIFRVIRKVAALARMLPHFDLS